LMALYIYRSMNSFSQKLCGSKLVLSVILGRRGHGLD
jgi:hypothetical protein